MRVLFCSLARPGFLHPCLAIAEELRARRHKVAFVTHVDLTPQLHNFGFERIPRGPNDGPSFGAQIWYEPLSMLIQVKHIEYAIQRFCPDILVGQHLTFGPLLVKERQGVPVALVGSATYLWPSRLIQHDGRGTSISERRKLWRFTHMLDSYCEARRLLHLSRFSHDDGSNPLIGDLFMVRSVPQLEKNFAELPEQVRLIGACLWEPTEQCAELEQWLDDPKLSHKPIVYVHQGKFFQFPHFWSRLLQLTCEVGVRIAASTDMMDCDIGRVPPGSFIRPQLPQGRIFRRASAAVLSANATGVLGALAAGVPTFLIPAGGEQPDVAEVCVAAGCSRSLDAERITDENLREGMCTLLSDCRMGAAAKRLAVAFSQTRSPEVAADLLEQAGSRSGSRPFHRTGAPAVMSLAQFAKEDKNEKIDSDRLK